MARNKKPAGGAASQGDDTELNPSNDAGTQDGEGEEEETEEEEMDVSQHVTLYRGGHEVLVHPDEIQNYKDHGWSESNEETEE